jgi:hypothetical protein
MSDRPYNGHYGALVCPKCGMYGQQITDKPCPVRKYEERVETFRHSLHENFAAIIDEALADVEKDREAGV